VFELRPDKCILLSHMLMNAQGRHPGCRENLGQQPWSLHRLYLGSSLGSSHTPALQP
jgi:hypothetical protein